MVRGQQVVAQWSLPSPFSMSLGVNTLPEPSESYSSEVPKASRVRRMAVPKTPDFRTRRSQRKSSTKPSLKLNLISLDQRRHHVHRVGVLSTACTCWYPGPRLRSNASTSFPMAVCLASGTRSHRRSGVHSGWCFQERPVLALFLRDVVAGRFRAPASRRHG